jgi:hypothetical protein
MAVWKSLDQLALKSCPYEAHAGADAQDTSPKQTASPTTCRGRPIARAEGQPVQSRNHDGAHLEARTSPVFCTMRPLSGTAVWIARGSAGDQARESRGVGPQA